MKAGLIPDALSALVTASAAKVLLLTYKALTENRSPGIFGVFQPVHNVGSR